MKKVLQLLGKQTLLFCLFLISSVSWGQNTYTLVTQTSDLVAGEKYLVSSGGTNGTFRFLGLQNSANRAVVNGTISSNSITTSAATLAADSLPFEITLGGSAGSWTLFDEVNGTLLGPARGSNSSNHLKPSTGTPTYTITFSSNAAVMTCYGSESNTNNRNIIRFNSTSNPQLFASYASGQAAVYLYKKAAPANAVPTVTNTTVSSIATNAATFAGNVTAINGSAISATGTVYSVKSTNANPQLVGTGVTNLATPAPGAGTGTFSNASGAVLSPNVQYSYNAYANNTTGTGYGTAADFYTLANVPLAPTVSNPQITTLDVSLNTTEGNPASTEYAIYEFNTDTYVQADGTLGVLAVWNTPVGWTSSIGVNGLTANTTYDFFTRARNGANTPTEFSANEGSGTTLANTLPTIETSTLAAFAATCINTSAIVQTLEVYGYNLTSANVVVGPLSGFAFSSDNGISYTAQVNLVPDVNGDVIQEVLVQFTPTAVQPYDATFPVSGGGASAVNVSVVASGINTAPTVTSPTSDSISTTTANLGGNITALGCSAITERGIYYSTTTGFADGDGISVSESGSYTTGIFTVDASGLTSNTTYYYKAFATSASSGTAYSAQGTFTTTCGVASLPFTQNFESVTTPALPTCSTLQNVGLGNNWVTSSVNDYGFSSKVLDYSYNSSNAANAWYYTQGISLTAGTTYQISYKYGNSSVSSFIEKLKVAYGNDTVNTAMTNELADYPNITGASAVTATNYFVAPATGVFYFGFNAYSDADQFDLYVDDIAIDVAPTCIAPTALTSTAFTATTASLSWTASASNPVDGYDYYYATSATAPDGSTTPSGSVASGVTTVGLSTLSSSTAYYFWVRANCGSGDTTAWAAGGSFATTALAAPLASIASDVMSTSFTANWDSVAGATGYVLDVYQGQVFELYNENFNTFTGSGFSNPFESGKINSNNWKISGLSDGVTDFGDNKSTGDYANGSSTGGVSGGGVYSFEVATANNIFGFQPTGTDFTPGDVTLRVQNTSGQTLNSLTISYKIYVNNNEARSTSFNFSHSADGSTFTNVTALDYISPTASDNNGWIQITKEITLTGLTLSDGSFYYVKWSSDDVAGSGSRDEIGLDDVVIGSTSLDYTIENQNVGNTTSYTVTGLNPETQYFYVVRATDGTASANSNAIEVNTLAAPVTWNGTAWSNTIGPDASADAFIDGNYSSTEDLICKDLTVNTGIVLTITATNTLSVSGNMTNNGSIVFESTAAGTGRFDAYTGAAITGTGTVTAERYVPAKRAYRILTTPLTGTTNNTISANWQGTPGEGLLLFSPATYQSQTMVGYATGGVAPNIRKYNGVWSNITDLTTEPMYGATATDTKPFLVFVTGADGSDNIASGAAATTLRPTGQLITGTVIHTGLAANTFYALANPYASAISPASLIANNAGKKLWLIDPSLGSFGAYATFDGTDWTPAAPSGAAANIQSGQGFFVRSASATSFAIAESDKVAGSSTLWFGKNADESATVLQKDKIRVLLYKQVANDFQLADGILAVNYADGTNDVDVMDTNKISNFNESIMFRNNTTNLAIEHRALPQAGDMQQVRMLATTAIPYQLRVYTESYTNSTSQPYLEDTTTGALTAIPMDGSEVIVPFTGVVSNTTTPDLRFRIVYQTNLSTATPSLTNVKVYPNPVVNGQLNINLGADTTNAKYTITNLLGQSVQQGELATTQNTITVPALTKGMYILNISQEERTYTTKIYVQ